MFVDAIRRFKPLRGLPIWARWLLSAAVVFIEFGLRLATGVQTVPYLWFIPGVIVTSFVFDRGSGFVATFLSAGLALYFFVTPRGSFEIADLDQLVALAAFTLSGLLVAAVIEALRHTVEELERKSQALQSADVQKALLLADINHRIKNHLQSVVGVLDIAARRAGTLDEAKAALDQAAWRLGMLGRVYDQLQLRDDATAVPADRFLSDLCGDLRATLVGLRPIALRVYADPVELDPTEAVNVGLIVNELVQNALKYAFPDDRAGTVAVRLERRDDCLFLEVADDGIGRADPAEAGPAGTGSRLLRALAQQLGGALKWSGPPGTRATLEFRRHATADLA
ncbi:sensor histidine kinase [Sphingomonas lenta]|uniref:histidine kinase n=1 Tax=Sphingomonas lenta TaxID=1141887 RepID=A0A2A2SJQ3_9SPHN|nr:DUF4118 domain-containing protein [Sphingomonas lenta]PAX09261.1 histidine kinase [Sphingomonas lenta]